MERAHKGLRQIAAKLIAENKRVVSEAFGELLPTAEIVYQAVRAWNSRALKDLEVDGYVSPHRLVFTQYPRSTARLLMATEAVDWDAATKTEEGRAFATRLALKEAAQVELRKSRAEWQKAAHEGGQTRAGRRASEHSSLAT